MSGSGATPVLIHDGAVVLYRAYWNADPSAFFAELDETLRLDPRACDRILEATRRRPMRRGELSTTLAVPEPISDRIRCMPTQDGETPGIASFVEAAILDLAQMRTVLA